MSHEDNELHKKGRRGPVLPTRAEYEKLGQWLRSKREGAGIQQKPLSRALNKPEQFLNKVEQGRQRLDVVEFLDWIQALSLDQSITLKDLIAALK